MTMRTAFTVSGQPAAVLVGALWLAACGSSAPQAHLSKR
jgi:hypothetical protein